MPTTMGIIFIVRENILLKKKKEASTVVEVFAILVI